MHINNPPEDPLSLTERRARVSVSVPDLAGHQGASLAWALVMPIRRKDKNSRHARDAGRFPTDRVAECITLESAVGFTRLDSTEHLAAQRAGECHNVVPDAVNGRSEVGRPGGEQLDHLRVGAVQLARL